MARYDIAGLQYEDNAGNPLIGGKLYFYESGTTTAKATFSDIEETTANANPVILDASGRAAAIYFSGDAKIIIKDSSDAVIETKDPVTASGSAGGRLSFSDWNALSTYLINDLVTGSDGKYYKCIVASSQGQDPISTADWREAKFIENGKTVTFFKGADVASAAELPLIDDGNYFDVTGTTTITSFADQPVGTVVKLHFDGALILTNNADIVCLSGANITTAAGGEAEFVYFETGKVRMTNYAKADGTGLIAAGGLAVGTPVASTSGTSIDFTGIPSGTKRITVQFLGLSTTGANRAIVQLGDSGGMETSGYTSGIQSIGGGTAATGTAGFFVGSDGSNAYTIYGSLIITIVDPAAFSWECFGVIGRDSGQHYMSTGGKALSAELTQIRITTTGGSQTFDAGTVNITYE